MTAPSPDVLNHLALMQGLVVEFRGCLMQESQALAQWPPQGLWPVQEAKVRLVRDLEGAHATLDALLRAEGRDLNDLSRLPAIAQPWQALRELLAECQRLNAGNEHCLLKQQQALKQSLELLVVKLDQSLTYGRQGMHQASRRMGSIGLA